MTSGSDKASITLPADVLDSPVVAKAASQTRRVLADIVLLTTIRDTNSTIVITDGILIIKLSVDIEPPRTITDILSEHDPIALFVISPE